MPRTSSLATKLRSLLDSSREVDALRTENAALMIEIKSLRQDAADIAKLLGGSVRRGPGRPRGSSAKRGPGRPKAARKSGGKRFRTSAADVDKMTKAIAAKAPSDWKTKAEIVKAAGLKLDSSAAAWKRATEGYELDGKKHAAVLKSNGARGLAGRYRKA